MFLRMIRGEEKSHATKKKESPETLCLKAPRSFNINAFTFLIIPRFSHSIPNGEGFLRDFGNAKLLRFVPCNLLLTYSFLFEFLC